LIDATTFVIVLLST